ncbi:hypothetical protein [Flavobacterium lindanitolerans]|uniref:hypothetical protein n=1 Tax=Flavobacterium lindanitolerans TaxID=428988 RepID=UPI0027BADF8A|nr:hypothetical protein [Flavobacterium lindanitolerans]
MKLKNFLNASFLLYCISSFSQNVASTATLTSGGLNAGTSGTQNTFYGSKAGKNNSSGNYNTFIGNEAGNSNTLGSNNTYIGAITGDINNGNNNTFIGNGAGGGYEGNENVFIGIDTGHAGAGSNNIFIGNSAGFGQITNNRLVIENNGQSVNPLIWGDFAQDQLKFNGKVGIGYGFGNFPTTAGSVNVSNYNLFVKGGILTEEVRVNLQSDWADYVFDKNYNLKSLEEVETFIIQNKHLPNMPSAKKVKEEGIELGEMIKMQQEKIEELTLYLLQLNKENQKEKEQNKILLKRLSVLEEKVNLLLKK